MEKDEPRKNNSIRRLRFKGDSENIPIEDELLMGFPAKTRCNKNKNLKNKKILHIYTITEERKIGQYKSRQGSR